MAGDAEGGDSDDSGNSGAGPRTPRRTLVPMAARKGLRGADAGHPGARRRSGRSGRKSARVFSGDGLARDVWRSTRHVTPRSPSASSIGRSAVSRLRRDDACATPSARVPPPSSASSRGRRHRSSSRSRECRRAKTCFVSLALGTPLDLTRQRVEAMGSNPALVALPARTRRCSPDRASVQGDRRRHDARWIQCCHVTWTTCVQLIGLGSQTAAAEIAL